MKDTCKQRNPTAVSIRTKRVGEAPGPWSWVEANVWTERMLTALEQGVKGGTWFSLFDKVYSMRNLRAAFTRVKRNKGKAGVDHVSIEMYVTRLEENLTKLQAELKQGRYQPSAVRRVWIPKPGTKERRPLGIPTVQDRIVQTALRNVLEPIFERDFAERSYGFRPQRGCSDALDRVEDLLDEGFIYVVDADLKSYFDSIPHPRLMSLVKTKITDGRVLDLIEGFLNQDVLAGLKGWTPTSGSPQGAVISPLLSNIYLDPLDHLMAEAGLEMVRYADDFVIMCRSTEEAQRALETVQSWVDEVGLTLHPDKTRIAEPMNRGDGFEFLGYYFERGYMWPRKKSLRKMKDAIRQKTKRTNGTSLECIINTVNSTLRGWANYFIRSVKYVFAALDKWVRMRLRSILRRRRKRKGRGRGRDHNRWPNQFFADRGVFSLLVAHGAARQPSLR